jgi:hypothetical protein
MDMIVIERGKRSPTPANAKHAELLAEVTQLAASITSLCELERSGIYDNLGQRFWVARDPLLETAKKIVTLLELRIGEIDVR